MSEPNLSPEVQAMLDDPRAPTAPWWLFAAAYRRDPRLWWRIGCGHHENLFNQLLEDRDDQQGT